MIHDLSKFTKSLLWMGLVVGLIIASFECTLFQSQAYATQSKQPQFQSLWHLAKSEKGLLFRVTDYEVELKTPVSLREEVYPAKYRIPSDLITPVRDQNPYGNCWAYSAIACVESSLLREGTGDCNSLDLSEMHLSWYAYNSSNQEADRSLYAAGDRWVGSDSPYNEGGNDDKAATTLLRGYGPVTTGTVPDDMMVPNPKINLQTKCDYFVKDVYSLPSLNEFKSSSSIHYSENLGALKKALVHNRPVSVYYRNDYNGYHEVNGDYFFFSNPNTHSVNHAVTLIGYDDTISKDNFVSSNGSVPGRDGAFLVKNSWGASWGNQGYFWISYEDSSLLQAWIYNATTKQYDEIYQYDGCGFGYGQYETTTYCSASNIFKARHDGYGEAIGIWTSVAGSTIKYKITDCSENTVLSSGVVSASDAGYRSITVPRFAMRKGQKYEVTIENYYMASDNTIHYLIPCESDYSGNGYVSLDFKEGEGHVTIGEEVHEPGYHFSGVMRAGNALVKLYANKEILPPPTGTCGDNMTWELNLDTGVLTIKGEGTMAPYTYVREVPWHKYCEEVTQIVMDQKITTISDYAFYGMINLKEISLPKSLESIGSYAFKQCRSLLEIDYPKTLKRIGESSFYGCECLREVTIPEGIYTVWEYTFKNCTSLYKVNLPNFLLTIDEAAFYGTAIKEIDIPDFVNTIYPYAFKKCKNLARISMPSHLTSLGDSSFYGCEQLTEIDIPEGVDMIGEYAFKGCKRLTDISLPDGIRILGESAFNSCPSLTEFTIPANITEVRDYCFANDINLRTITFLGDAPSFGTGVFKADYGRIYYPADNPTWTEDVRKSYGGDMFWKKR